MVDMIDRVSVAYQRSYRDGTTVNRMLADILFLLDKVSASPLVMRTGQTGTFHDRRMVMEIKERYGWTEGEDAH